MRRWGCLTRGSSAATSGNWESFFCPAANSARPKKKPRTRATHPPDIGARKTGMQISRVFAVPILYGVGESQAVLYRDRGTMGGEWKRAQAHPDVGGIHALPRRAGRAADVATGRDVPELFARHISVELQALGAVRRGG